MVEISGIGHYNSFNYCVNDLIDGHSGMTKLYKRHNNYNSFGDLLSNYKITVNNPLFKENNFFLKTKNNEKSKYVDKYKKEAKLNNYYNNLIINTNPICNNKEMHNKNSKSLINLNKNNRMTNYYSNIYINNQYNDQRILNNKNQLVSPLLINTNSELTYNNNSYQFIYPYINKIENNKNIQIINKVNYQNQKNNQNNNNKRLITKFPSSPYLNINLTENQYINGNEYYNRIKHNYNVYKRNNIINFNENINYNNINNINNNTENNISKKIINYNQDNNHTFFNNSHSKNIKTKIKIKVYPNYQKIKNIPKTYHANKNKNKNSISKINFLKKNLCLKCQNHKKKQNNEKNEPFLDNYAFYERKNINQKKSNINYNTNKAYNLNNKTEQNLTLNTNIINQNKKLKLNDTKILSLAKKNFELFLKKNNKLNLKDINNNIKKRKRQKSQNQIDKEKNLDKYKSLSYRESMSLKPDNSLGKNKINILNNITKTLSQKKYKEDDKNFINKEEMKDIRYTLFDKQKENINENKNTFETINIKRYNDNDLKKQIGCKFSILKKDKNNINECLNEIITYFNSENLRNQKFLH